MDAIKAIAPYVNGTISIQRQIVPITPIHSASKTGEEEGEQDMLTPPLP